MEFDGAILQIADRVKRTLAFIPSGIKEKCEEIRLRAGLPVGLTIGGRVLFVCENSVVCDTLPKNPFVATQDDVNLTLSLLCNRSIYLHESEIKQGFISLPHGCRAGVCGVFNDEGMLVSVSSINIRIARQFFGSGRVLLPHINDGLLILGPPGCGKTTLLRDVVRLLSNGSNGEYYRMAVIDSRGEISGGGMLDLGVNTDVLYTTNKAVGIDIALRTMFPNFIAFDEIGTAAELASIQSCFNAGVGIITTAHCKDKSDILRRDVTHEIIKSGAIGCVALLSETLGKTPEIMSIEEFENVCS